MRFMIAVAVLVGTSATSAIAQSNSAQHSSAAPTRTILIGGIIDFKPAFPGADSRNAGFFPLIAVWNAGERMPVETPDESFGINFLGDDEGTSAGLALTASPRRRSRDLPPTFSTALSTVGFGVEAGGFVQSWVGDNLRLRAELRQGIGGHDALTGDVAADLVVRTPDDGLILTVGPRARWGSGGFTRTYFGVTAAEALATGLTAYRPGSGLYAYGAVSSAHVHVTPSIGVYGYAGYERLTGDAARSPVVTQIGSRDQLSFGVGLSYRFSVSR